MKICVFHQKKLKFYFAHFAYSGSVVCISMTLLLNTIRLTQDLNDGLALTFQIPKNCKLYRTASSLRIVQCTKQPHFATRPYVR